MNADRLRWYLNRLAAMSPAEIWWRLVDHLRKLSWRRLQVRPGDPVRLPRDTRRQRSFTAVLGPDLSDLDPAASQAVIEAADRILAGTGELLGVHRTDLDNPDWFRDPATGVYCEPDRYVFAINFKDEAANGNAKQLWEISRLQHLTVLATAYRLTGEDRYAERTADQLTSWWQANPFLSGVNWACGIEVGIRLITWAWVRRLLDGWTEAPDLFENNPLAVAQIAWHQQYLAGFRSRGSSANNHVIAEAAGQLVGAAAFPWFGRSRRWQTTATAVLERELDHNTFPDGINRELAFDYQAFVIELGLAAAAEAAATGRPLSVSTLNRLCAMSDAVAAVADRELGAPRQGDGDDGRGLVLDDPQAPRWAGILALGAAVFGPMSWWPDGPRTVAGSALSALFPTPPIATGRPATRPSRFTDAGMTILRTPPGGPEIWCRTDSGPHGFLSIAGHAHADALAVEVRYDGVEVLTDPGTYCYHGDPQWRSYFRSTIGHNTVEIGGRDSSVSGGPFLWREHASATTTRSDDLVWEASHDGYRTLDPSITHRRRAELEPEQLRLSITDLITAGEGHEVRMAFHLGPDIEVDLEAGRALLRWAGPTGPASAELALPAQLSWQAHRGQTEPILGWYSPSFGVKVPSWTLIGTGQTTATECRLATALRFGGPEKDVEMSGSTRYQTGEEQVLSDVSGYHVSVSGSGRAGAGQHVR